MKVHRLAGMCLGLWAAVWAAPAALAQWNPPNPVVSFQKQANGLDVQQKNGAAPDSGRVAGDAARDLRAARGSRARAPR